MSVTAAEGGKFLLVFCFVFVFVLLIGAYSGTTFDTFDVWISLLTTMESVCQFLSF